VAKEQKQHLNLKSKLLPNLIFCGEIINQSIIKTINNIYEALPFNNKDLKEFIETFLKTANSYT